jgi:hypothetical protein
MSQSQIKLFDTSKVIMISRTVSSGSVSSADSDCDDCVLPFTRSPLDECRGSDSVKGSDSREKYAFTIGDVITKNKKKKTRKVASHRM